MGQVVLLTDTELECTNTTRNMLIQNQIHLVEVNDIAALLTAACSGCAVVWRGSNESNSDQTALSAACSDFAQVRRCSN